MNQLRRILAVLALSYVVLAPAAQGADDPKEASRRYQEGTAALKEKRFREAALAFEAATKLRPHGVAAFAAATAWDSAEQPARAADNFHRALELPGLKEPDTKTARDRLDALEKSLGTIVITGPAELTVQLENSTEANPPARLHGAPGVHVLIVVRDSKIERKDLKLEGGSTIEIDVTNPIEETKPPPEPSASAPAPVDTEPPPPPPKESDGASTRKLIGYSAMGAGVVAGGVAVVLGLQTLSARDDYEAGPSQEGYDDAVSMRLYTNIAWAGAAVLGGVGIALVVWPEGKPKEGEAEASSVSFSPAPSGFLIRGAF